MDIQIQENLNYSINNNFLFRLVTPGAQPMNVPTPATMNDMQNKARFQRVLQTTPISLPSNVTLSSPVRLVQPGQSPQVGSTIMVRNEKYKFAFQMGKIQ